MVNRPMMAVGGRASPRGHIILIPAKATTGLRPLVLKRRISGTPRTGAAPHIKTASEIGRVIKSEAMTTATGRVTTDTAINPLTPVRVII